MSGWATNDARLPSLWKRQTAPAWDASKSGRPMVGRASTKYATGSYPSMARPLKRLTTTRSVVEAWAANSAGPSAPRPIQLRLILPGPIQPTLIASKPIKAIPGRTRISGRLPFLSCRCAVIVDADNIRVGGHWAQPKPMLVSVRLRLRSGFQYPGVFHDFRLSPCSGNARRDDVLFRARFRAAADARPTAATAAAASGTPAQPQYLRAGRT